MIIKSTQRSRTIWLILPIAVTLLSHIAIGGCSRSLPYPDWLNCKLAQVVQARLNQNGSNKQTDTPSVSANSNTLVDQSSAGDLVGMALNLGGLTSKSNTANATSPRFAKQ